MEKNVAFFKKTANWKNNVYRYHVWLYEKDKEQCYPVTTSNIESTSPLWSPNSKHLAYLSPDGDGEQRKKIFVKSKDRESGVQITDEKEDVNFFLF